MADWDENSPADNDIVSQYPANERASRSAVISNFGVDHHEANDANIGKHEAVQLLDQIGDPTITAGQVGIWNNGGNLNTRVGAGGVLRVMRGESGTRAVFYQASAPTGWTQDATVNDRALRVVSGAGGGTGGSWTISGVTVGGHALTVSELPSHSHSASTGSAGGHNHGGSTGSAGGHSHSASTGSAGGHGHSFRFGSTSDGGADNYLAGSLGTKDSATGTQTASSSVEAVGNHSHSVSVGGVSNHGHSISTQAAHTHSVSVGNTGSGNTHNHGVSADGNWRPSYIDVIVASLD